MCKLCEQPSIPKEFFKLAFELALRHKLHYGELGKMAYRLATCMPIEALDVEITEEQVIEMLMVFESESPVLHGGEGN